MSGQVASVPWWVGRRREAYGGGARAPSGDMSMSNLMSGGAMTRTSAFSGLKRRLMLRKAGMAASFSTGTSAGERGQVRGPGRQRRRTREQGEAHPAGEALPARGWGRGPSCWRPARRERLSGPPRALQHRQESTPQNKVKLLDCHLSQQFHSWEEPKELKTGTQMLVHKYSQQQDSP